MSRARELARQRDLTENEGLSEVIRHLEALARRKSSNSFASSVRVLVVAGDKGGGGTVLGDDLRGKAAPFFQPAGESKSASFANRMGSGSRRPGISRRRQVVNGAPFPRIGSRSAPPAWENGRLFRGDLFPPRRDKAKLKTVDISRASRPATRKR